LSRFWPSLVDAKLLDAWDPLKAWMRFVISKAFFSLASFDSPPSSVALWVCFSSRPLFFLGDLRVPGYVAGPKRDVVELGRFSHLPTPPLWSFRLTFYRICPLPGWPCRPPAVTKKAESCLILRVLGVLICLSMLPPCGFCIFVFCLYFSEEVPDRFFLPWPVVAWSPRSFVAFPPTHLPCRI